jgi:hypothetical protein
MVRTFSTAVLFQGRGTKHTLREAARSGD